MTLSEITTEIESICDDAAALSAVDVFDHVQRTLRDLSMYTRLRRVGCAHRAAGRIADAMRSEEKSERLLDKVRDVLTRDTDIPDRDEPGTAPASTEDTWRAGMSASFGPLIPESKKKADSR